MDGPRASTFGPNLTPLFLLKMVKIEKTNSSAEKLYLHDSWITSCKKSFGLNISKFCDYKSQETF